MFITSAKEIIEACPSAKLDAKAAEKLIHSIEEEEDQMLEPLIGYDLMTELAGQYRDMMEFYGGITTPIISISGLENAELEDINPLGTTGTESSSSIITVDVQKRTIPLIRDIQAALVYRMFANKIYSISTSLNLGGGANRASAGDYEPADDKHIQELRREFFMNSKRACDNILIRLERDAKSAHPLWHDLWRDAESYYMKEDLLFPTLKSFAKFYPCSEPTKFISLSPAIRYCQDQYIAPRVDDDLLDKLLDPCQTLNTEELNIQKKLRTALAYYVRAKEGSRDERNEALMTADAAMQTALAYIDKVTSSPSVAVSVETPSSDESPMLGNYCGEQSDTEEYSSFCTLFAPGLNRY